MLRYLVIDLDDTLVMTSRANSLAYMHALREQEGINLSPVWGGHIRLTFGVMKQVLLNLDTKRLASLKQRKDILYHSYLHDTQVNQKVLKLMEQHRTLTPILLTNSEEGRAVATLKYHQLHKYFAQILFCKGGNKYQYLLEQLDTTADLCLIVENELAQIKLAYQIGFSHQNSVIINEGLNYE